MSLSSGEYKLANVQYPEEKTNVKFVIFNITYSILLLLICDFSQSQNDIRDFEIPHHE